MSVGFRSLLLLFRCLGGGVMFFFFKFFLMHLLCKWNQRKSGELFTSLSSLVNVDFTQLILKMLIYLLQ